MTYKETRYSYIRGYTQPLPVKKGLVYFKIKNFKIDKVIQFNAKVWKNNKWRSAKFDVKVSKSNFTCLPDFIWKPKKQIKDPNVFYLNFALINGSIKWQMVCQGGDPRLFNRCIGELCVI